MTHVFYRKWRPQTLSEIVGQEHVTRTLLNAISGQRVSHAYLFCGPRGTGKTSTGRILAKAVNCINPTTGGKNEPCNTCTMCKAISEGRALDVIEIDAASHTGVDDVRDLIERVAYATAEARYKVYIIDEVHMLSTSASNALLKTLEEPPPHVIFILATTETHKVLRTIVSRCQRFDFHRLCQKDTEEKLLRITNAEGITITSEALRLVAKSARGGLRDAENMLEQIYTYYGADVSLVQVQKMLGLGGDEHVRELIKHLLQKDLGAGLKSISRAAEDGIDLRQMGREVVSFLRELLLLKGGVDKDSSLTTEEISELKTLLSTTSMEQIVRAIKLFSVTESTSDDNSTLPMELALVDACIGSVSEKLVPHTMVTVQSAAVTPHKQSPQPTQHNVAPLMYSNINRSVRTTENTSLSESVKISALENAGSPLEQLTANWNLIVQQVPDAVRRSAAVAMLRSAGIKPVAIENDTVVLSFKHSYHRDKMDETENKKIVANILSQFIGKTCQIKCIFEPEENHLVREAQKLGAQIIDVEDRP